MSIRRTNPVTLFPFLAVLVCAMGALIFLLLITTRRIRSEALAQPIVELPDTGVLRTHLLTAVQTTQLLAASPHKPPVPDSPTTREAPPDAGADGTNKELELAVAELQDECEDGRLLISSEREALKQERRKLAQLGETLDRSFGERRRLASAREHIAQQQMRLSESRRQTSVERRSLADEIVRAQQVQAATTRYSIVPYDGRSGTTRRPILIECTEDWLRFIPENVEVSEADLEGFAPDFNPLLAGATELVRYWQAVDRNASQENPADEPYILLIVRPSGTLAFYAARIMLSELKVPFGYELLGHDVQLELPPVDHQAQAVCRAAVDRIVAQRVHVAATGQPAHRPSATGYGRKTDSQSGGRALRIGADGQIRVDEPADHKNGFAVQRRTVERTNVDGGRLGQTPEASSPPTRKTLSSSAALAGGGPADRSNTVVGSATADLALGHNSTRHGQFAGPQGRASSHNRMQGRGSAPSSASPNLGRSPGRADQPVANVHDNGSSASARGKRSEGRTGSGPQKQLSGNGAVFGAKSTAIESSADSTAAGRGLPRSMLDPLSNRPRRFPNFGANVNSGPAERDAPQRAAATAGSMRRTGKRRWGLSPASGVIGFEREITIHVDKDRIVVARRYEIPLSEAASQRYIMTDLLDVLDRHARTWGQPPRGYYWVPTLRLVTGSGGRWVVDLLREPLRESDLSTQIEVLLQEHVAPLPRELQP